jgi:hypothetical protein
MPEVLVGHPFVLNLDSRLKTAGMTTFDCLLNEKEFCSFQNCGSRWEKNNKIDYSIGCSFINVEYLPSLREGDDIKTLLKEMVIIYGRSKTE